MDNTLRKQINELAETVLDVFDISRPITNMNNVINILGGEIREDASLGLFSDGKVYKEKDNSKGFSFYIVVPSNQPDARKNFTVAHELGHLFLHMGYKINDELWAKSDDVVFNRRGNSEIELQANEFAVAFAECDDLVLTDIYAAREKDTGLISSQDLVEVINENSHNAVYIKEFDDVAAYFKKQAQPGDIIITMGAGDVYKIGESML